ncbi:hypothetical protein P3342_006497 [Pyrenophora teres f. teres]|nr:hypothetical protein P3342_006497 [Pyrenophora teres f. teres]
MGFWMPKKTPTQQVVTEISRLVHLLELHESIIVNLDTVPTMLATQGGVVSCSAAIYQIRSKVGDVKPAGGFGLCVCMKKLAKRLTFPYEESDVKYCKTIISDIRQSLRTALHALQM